MSQSDEGSEVSQSTQQEGQFNLEQMCDFVKAKALFGRNELHQVEDDSFDGYNFYIFKAGSKELKIQPKLIRSLGGSVRLSPNKEVNALIVADHVFDLPHQALMSPDHGYPEIPPKKESSGKGFANVFEFLMAEQWNIVTVSEMRLLMDKLESSISLEWHLLRGLEPNEKQMSNPK